ncbi:hypothetical protein H072_10281 [Dactylellina haptotyla CBS 200.50]|uniref:Wax synthase domain-containing protein n=1 Tax=Dactylellina haptotyla (strain CBS 200.50) TaxID=1284197 RepID=S8A4U4_DACHA|nr:hypothetical protein H072_10281 [Dactylellina haptotyla CBS 200.50]
MTCTSSIALRLLTIACTASLAIALPSVDTINTSIGGIGISSDPDLTNNTLSSSGTLSQANILISFVVFQLCFLTQKPGSLPYIARLTWFWRVNHLLCLYESVIILYFLLFRRRLATHSVKSEFSHMATALLYVRRLPLKTDIYAAENIVHHLTPYERIPSAIGLSLSEYEELSSHSSRGTVTDIAGRLSQSRFSEAKPDLPWLVTSPSYSCFETRLELWAAMPMIAISIKALYVRGAPLFTAVSAIYFTNWALVLLLQGLKNYRDLPPIVKGENELQRREDEHIKTYARDVVRDLHNIQRRYTIPRFVRLLWFCIVFDYLAGVLIEYFSRNDGSSFFLVVHYQKILLLGTILPIVGYLYNVALESRKSNGSSRFPIWKDWGLPTFDSVTKLTWEDPRELFGLPWFYLVDLPLFLPRILVVVLVGGLKLNETVTVGWNGLVGISSFMELYTHLILSLMISNLFASSGAQGVVDLLALVMVIIPLGVYAREWT